MKSKFAVAACSLVLSLGCAFAQTQPSTPPNPPDPAQHAAHEVAMLTRVLSLNSAQQTQATKFFTDAAAGAAKLRTNMEAAHKQLETAIENNDTATVASAATQIGDLTAQRIQAEATANAALYAILTAEQQTKFKVVLAHGPGHGPGRFGGPHGPGAPPPPPPPSE